MSTVLFLQFDEKGSISVAFQVVHEIRRLGLVMEFAEDDMVDRHPEGAILSGMGRDPPVSEFRGHTEVGRQNGHFRAVVAGLGQEMHVRGPGHARI